MANTYYVFSPSFIPGQKVRSDEVNTQYSAVETGFDLLPTDNSAISRGTTFLGVDSGTANAIDIALTDTRTSYQDGDQISWKANTTNTGAATLDIDGIGAVSIVGADGSALAAGDVAADLYYTAIYDSTNNRWQMLGASAAALAAADDRVTWAAEWAVEVEDTLVSVAAGGDGASDYSALHWAAKASVDAASASSSESNASTSEINALASEVAAAASAAGVDLPVIGVGDQFKLLWVKSDETGYELVAQGPGSGLHADYLDSQHGSYYLARANHTGTQAMATISDAGALSVLDTIDLTYVTDSGSLAALNTISNTNWSGTDLSVANGGTGVSTVTEHAVLLGNGAGALGEATISATAGYPLASKGTGVNPDFQPDIRLQTATFEFLDVGNSGTSETITWANGNKQKMTLTGNCTVTLTAPSAAQSANLTFMLIQDGTGSRTVTWPSTVKWPGGVAPTLSTGAGDIDIINMFYSGTNYYSAALLDFG